MTWIADYNLPFTAALGLMLFMAVLQIVGIGDLFDADVDVEADFDAATSAGLGGAVTTLLGIGKVPFFVWLVVFLFLFAGIGYGIQGLADSLLGAPFDALVAAVLALIGTVPVTSVMVRPLGAIMPKDETSAVGLDSLVGRRGVIATGRATRGSPARAKVRDRHGHAHHVMVEPHEDSSEIHEGDEVLLVRREGQTFYGNPVSERRLSPAG
ncbi:YqiJ family protein [Parerythrobacter aestuarii]|uniref:YqiJ family protein n=1 Tax=Parerythrobacter aestuarii TaxID=3020909 RepID=UPI0024DE54AA|nr:YqiJ family protein [Parerythrobacter aestuarii]